MSHVTVAHAPAYRSYVDQCVHYLDRASEGVPDGPVLNAAAWRGMEMREVDDWRYTLTSADLAEIEDAIGRVRGQNKPLGSWTCDDVPLPSLSERIADWRQTLSDGRGFLLIRGVPVQRWAPELCEQFFWALGLHLGVPGAQNTSGDLLGHVMDTGNQRPGAVIRLYQTAEDIAFHCDAADVVGLLCLDRAARGGASRIASSVTVWNEIWQHDPVLARRLFEPVYVDLREERSPQGNPWNVVTPCAYGHGKLRTFYHSDYFRSAARHESLGISEGELGLFRLYDRLANREDVCLDMDLAPGDVQLVSNHTIVHARTAYEDSADHHRHLLRLWLSL